MKRALLSPEVARFLTRLRREVGLVQLAVSLGGAALLYALWRGVATTYQLPDLWAVLLGFAVVAFAGRRVPTLVWLWWLAGCATLLWSLAPGNTLVNSLWELLFLAAFAAGRWRAAFWALNVVLLIRGLDQTLLLYSINMQMFSSGGISYVAGAQALLLVPLSLVYLYRVADKRLKVALGLVLLASLYLALISGSRAVYLPLLIVLPLAVTRLLVAGRRWYVLALGTLLVIVSLIGIDTFIPNQPMRTALLKKSVQTVNNLQSPQTVQDPEMVREEGALSTRLKMWRQTLGVAWTHPFGTGTGSFRYVLPAFLTYPMLAFNSAHNYYLESAMTGGWLRLGLLLALLLPALYRAWRSGDDWPWALAVGGYWTTLAFDVTGYYPSFMMLAFLSLGALSAPVKTEAPGPLHRGVAWSGVTLAALFALWWYWPCTAATCATGRYLGFPSKALSALAQVQPDERGALLEDLRTLYPASFWVYQAQRDAAATIAEELTVVRDMVAAFPLLTPNLYLEWANLALEQGDAQGARMAIETGLERFPPDFVAPSAPLANNGEKQRQWLSEAERILAELDAQ